jgi:hypothetical protein
LDNRAFEKESIVHWVNAFVPSVESFQW